MKFNTISIVGLGYIGLPTAAVIAGNGIRVKGVDVSEYVVNCINQGKIHIVEPGLELLVKTSVEAGFLTAHTESQPADAFLIAVPTPFKGDDYEPDLKYIEAAAKALATKLVKGNLVVLESTSPIGATEKMAAWLHEVRPDLSFPQTVGEGEIADILVAHCPERVLPGQVIRELVENDRVIGGMDQASTDAATAVYKMFVHKGNCIATNARTAEMAKLTENASRDVQIAFANELSMICDKQGIDVWELIELANLHPRVNILQPGAGVGGHCIAVDPWFIVNQNPDEAKLIHQARKTNDFKPEWVINKIEDAVKSIDNPKIACLGLAFKPDIDDLRESPALEITKALAIKGYNILAVEPNIDELPAKFSSLENIKLTPFKDAVEQADLVAVLVKHKEFVGMVTSLNKLDFVNAK
ncbi:UDP-N-acetyl-D-mannosamine dehydrogenase [Shewanella violacea]|uniref:UDP-N-acetyl-D-mannosamine dehydrogenase n=1 Tax=Shewanella violacea (strain JCM 10179 / CIP 106290 / LMG 19151 / DSS12) TaxID=637905 RepID=D4ZFZ1_SHEVD|nr:UDP-N-acetyl-D-mannosamine dehydrogenase [Shewanella violacea]BAJ00590.1 UDP-N-acetyl-D-mannosamine dehydrogenase [Shewanella violacea DSS12]